ncbi:hypothetical protein OROMI_022681 [Orobanche minor]
MGLFSISKPLSGSQMLSLVVVIACFVTPCVADFNTNAEIKWGNGRGKIIDAGRGLSLSMDNFSGSGFQSKKEYVCGRFDMQIKLVPGDSAGSVTTFYLSSQGAGHDEVDFEFLGNASGEPYTVHTNVFAQGKGDKEQQFRLWFNPTAAYHTYSILWNLQRIVFLVDNIPIRVFNNHNKHNVPFPRSQPMRVYCSLWNAEEWATQGGRIKTDWTKAPFTAYYRNFKISACAPGPSGDPCRSQTEPNSWQTYQLDANSRNRMRWVQQKYRIYDYCGDNKRFPNGTTHECKLPRF